MAGIGFELKKLFKGKGLLQVSKACLFSTLVTVAPTLLCIIMLTILQKLMHNWKVPAAQRELFMAAVIYSFVFSLILTNGFTIILSRYVSDKIYRKEPEHILPSLKGAITICMAIGGIAGVAFYYRSPLNIPFKLVAYILFMELNILWLETVYVSALRDYTKLVKGFFMGVCLVFFLSYLMVKLLSMDAVIGVLASIDSGFLIIILFFFDSIQSSFDMGKGKLFTFLEYLDQYTALFFIGIFYALGLYVHNFLFWISDIGIIIDNTYAFAPAYDIPCFWAYLTAMPAIVIFVVSCETSIYETYKNYYNTICNEGIWDSIVSHQNKMRNTISHGLKKVMGLQMIFTILSLILGMALLPSAALEYMSVYMFSILVIGNYAFIIMFTYFTVLLYFDDKKGALILVCFFTLSNTLLTRATILMGETYYGLGFTIAAFLSLAISFLRLEHILRNISYFTFCSQPIAQSKNKRPFTWLSNKIHSALDKSKAV